MSQLNGGLISRMLSCLPRGRPDRFLYGIADQAFSVGGIFVANVVLARVASKEEYGMFTVVYSVLNFVTGLHNAVILEPYTVYGAGRYRGYSTQYRWLIWRSNAWLGLGLTAFLLLTWRFLLWTSPAWASRSLLGLALSGAIVLTASVLRRMLYVEQRVPLAARMSLVFFVTLLVLLGVWAKVGALDGLAVFLILAIASLAGALAIFREVPRRVSLTDFLEGQGNHWQEHWKYARWVVATAFLCQFAIQAYYWLAGGLLSLKDVAGLRAITMIVMPVDQVFTAITLMVLPMMAARYAAKQVGELLSLWRRYLAGFLLIGGAYMFGIVLVGGPLLHVIYGGKFDDVSSLLGTLALLPLVMSVGHTMNAVLKSIERPNLVFYAYAASGATTLVAGITLMVRYGLRGAVYGMLLSGAMYSAVLGIGFLYDMPRLHSLRLVRQHDKAVVSEAAPLR